MNKYILYFFIGCLALSCKSDGKKDNTSASPSIEIKNTKFENLPPLPQDKLRQLYADATYIDYIFYDLPFSISQDNKPSIHSNLQMISIEQMGGILKDCKSIGREFFHVGGNIAYEAEIYFQDGCYGYVFMDKQKPIYANKVSEAVMKFYSNIIAQAAQIKSKALNGG